MIDKLLNRSSLIRIKEYIDKKIISIKQAKQDKLIAGENIVIGSDGKTISASGKAYTAGTGLSITDSTINHSNSVTAQATQKLGAVSYDAQGHITGFTEKAVVDNLTSTATDQPLSAKQGSELNNKFGNYLPLAGGTMTGGLTLTAGNDSTGIFASKNSGFIKLSGNTDASGSYVCVGGKNWSDGTVYIKASSGSISSELALKANGTITWKDYNVLTSASIVDNLTSTSTTTPLSANQGKVLNDTKQDKLTAGENITISGNTISASGLSSEFTGATTKADGAKGVVPAPAKLTDGTTNYVLMANGSWGNPTADFDNPGFMPKLEIQWSGQPMTYLDQLGQWKEPSVFNVGFNGYVPTPGTTHGNHFLRSDATWQPVYSAGDNVQISDTNVISATDTTYDDYVGVTSSSAGVHGLVPACSAGTDNMQKVLYSNGTWAPVFQMTTEDISSFNTELLYDIRIETYYTNTVVPAQGLAIVNIALTTRSSWNAFKGKTIQLATLSSSSKLSLNFEYCGNAVPLCQCISWAGDLEYYEPSSSVGILSFASRGTGPVFSMTIPSNCPDFNFNSYSFTLVLPGKLNQR